MPDERGPSYAYPSTAVDETAPKLQERAAARKAAYEAALDAGQSEKAARLAAAAADARTVRLQFGLSSGDEEEAAYERAEDERKARAKQLAKRTPEPLRIGVNVVRRR